MIPEYADFMYEVGLLDENQREYFRSITNKVTDLIKGEEWVKAFQVKESLAKQPLWFYNCEIVLLCNIQICLQ